MQLVSFFCGLWEGSSQSTCANGRRHIMYHRAAKHTALCKSKREGQGATAGDSITFKHLLEVQQCTAVVAQKKTVIMGDMMENRVVSALTQHISWPNGNINRDHLAPLGNHMDNTWAPLGTTWRSQVGTTWKLHGQYLSTT